MLFLTRPPDGSPTSSNDPVLIVGAAARLPDVSDIERMAEQRLAQISEINHVELLSGRELTLAGLPAFESIASARYIETGDPLSIYQMLALDGERTILIQGLVGQELADEYLPEFRKVSASFRVGD